MLSESMEKQCEMFHRLDSLTQSAWCQASQEQPTATPPSIESFFLDVSELLCPARNLFCRSKIENLPPLAYDLFLPLDLDPLPMPFQNEGLNLAAACIRKYLKLGEDYEWFHCMVKASSFPNFYRAIEADQGQSRLLPFSTWCDGGSHPEARHRHHRHMIIVSPTKGRFHRRVCRKIKLSPEERPSKRFNCIRKKPIESALDLLNTMGYLSQHESLCYGHFERNHKPLVKSHSNHFWILTALPTRFKIPVAMQWDGGLLQLIHQEYKYLQPDILARAPVQFIEDRFQIAVKDLPGIQLFQVLPVSKEFKPSVEQGPTEHFLHFNGGRKLYFDKDYSLLSLDSQTWCQIQAKRGNLLYAAVGEELWTPCPFQQKCLRAIEPFKVENAELKVENAELKKELARKKELAIKTWNHLSN